MIDRHTHNNMYPVTDKGSPLTGMSRSAQLVELNRVISALEDGSADISTLKDLAHLCSDNPVQENGLLDTMNLSESSYPDSPTPIIRKLGGSKTIWEEEKIFNRMFNALLAYLSVDRVGDVRSSYNRKYLIVFGQEVEKLEYGLIALWEIIENQAVLAEGRENDLFTGLLRLRFCSKNNVRTFQCISTYLLINYYHNRYSKQLTQSETLLCPG